MKINSNNSNNKSKTVSEKGNVVVVLSVVVVLIFVVAGLVVAVMPSISEPFVVVAEAKQTTGNDPMNCFRSNVTINTCPLKSNITGIINNDPLDCFKTAGKTKVAPGDIQNYTKSVQNFVSLIPSAGKITAINKNIVGGSGPVKDMAGIWNVMNNANMTRYKDHWY